MFNATEEISAPTFPNTNYKNRNNINKATQQGNTTKQHQQGNTTMPKRYLSEDSKGQTGDKEAVEVGEKIPLDWQDRGEELPDAMMIMVMMVMGVMVIMLVMLTMMRRRERRRKNKEIRVLP